jgi:chromosome condensin MukBEF ATPase and DNA-binding subunit MukB
MEEDIWIDEAPCFLSTYDPDRAHAVRPYLTATFPETRDIEACPACSALCQG